MISRFPVERAHVMQFARALGDHDTADRLVAGDDVPVPPTFLEAGAHFDPEAKFRPKPGVPWPGSGKHPSGVPYSESGSSVGMHAEQRYVFARPPRIGDLLSARETAERSWDRPSRNGRQLYFTEITREYRDDAGDLVATAYRTIVMIQAAPDGPESTSKSRDQRPPPPTEAFVPSEEWTLVLSPDLTRTQIVQYAGASGDFNPLHTDEVYATLVAGHRSVFAHGMLTMGMAARVVTDRYGNDAVVEYSARFIGQVWPGDRLEARAAPQISSNGSLSQEGAGRTSTPVQVTVTANGDRPVLQGLITVGRDAGGENRSRKG